MPLSPMLIGVDCAAAPQRVGLALAAAEPRGPRILQTAASTTWDGLVDMLRAWMHDAGRPALLGLDAPLGWPAAMGQTLLQHQAGQPLFLPPAELFSRLTDRVVSSHLGKRPMEVGANLIARVALAAVNLLERLRRESGQPLPLGWTPGEAASSAVLEVYPAGALAARGLLAPGYKKTAASREEMTRNLQAVMTIPPAATAACIGSDHILDACLCCLGCWEYLQGTTPGPDAAQAHQARKEGWIWVRRSPTQDFASARDNA